MKIDLFTKGILTVIAVALVIIAIDTQPVKQAQAFSGRYEVSSAPNRNIFWVSDGKRVKLCYYEKGTCMSWMSIN